MDVEFSAVMFDMDGLVLDTEPGYLRAWHQAGEQMGIDFSQDFCASLSGCSGAAVTERLRAYCGADFDIQGFAALSSAFWHVEVREAGIPVKPGFYQVIDMVKAHGLPFCLVTNSPEKAARECLAYAGLQGVFAHIIGGDAVPVGKPAPDIYWRAAAELGQSPSTCLVLEDSPIGIRAAVAAGSPCIFVPSVQPVDAWAAAHADYVLADLQQVADFISARRDHPL